MVETKHDTPYTKWDSEDWIQPGLRRAKGYYLLRFLFHFSEDLNLVVIIKLRVKKICRHNMYTNMGLYTHVNVLSLPYPRYEKIILI